MAPPTKVSTGPPPVHHPVHPTRMRRGNTEEFAGVYTSAPNSLTDFDQLPLTTIESIQGIPGSRVGGIRVGTAGSISTLKSENASNEQDNGKTNKKTQKKHSV